MNPHKPGKDHPDENGNQRKSVVLLSNDFVIEAEDVLPDEAPGRSVMLSLLSRCH
jgi:hypothetical protein